MKSISEQELLGKVRNVDPPGRSRGSIGGNIPLMC